MFFPQVLDCLESCKSSNHLSNSLNAAEEGRELIFPPISISGEAVTETATQLGPKFDLIHWMNSSKQESRVHAVLDSELKSLVSVQFEVISSFWLNFPPAIDDITAVKRCFRLSKVCRDYSSEKARELLTLCEHRLCEISGIGWLLLLQEIRSNQLSLPPIL